MKVFINTYLCMIALIISVHFCQAQSADHNQLRKKALTILEEACIDTNSMADTLASLPSENAMTLALALEALKVVESEKIDEDVSNLQPLRFQLTQEIINFMQAEGISLTELSHVIRLPEIGPNATSSGGSNNFAEGNGAQANPTSGDSAVALGNNAIAAVQDTVAIGNAATVTFQSGIALGLNSVVTGTDAVALGNAASAGQARAVALGAGASTTQADAIILGNASNANVAVGIGSSTPAGKLTVFGDANKTALLLTSFSNQSALLLTTTAGLSVAKLSTDPTQPALSIADASGNFATAPAGTRMIVNGASSSSGSSTISSGTLVISAGNIILPVANATGSQGLLELGGSSTISNVELYEFGTRNLFAGNYTTPNTSVTGTDNVSIGTNANSSLLTSTNTIAIGSNAMVGGGAASNSVVIGNSAVSSGFNNIALGLAATATGANPNKIAIGTNTKTGGVSSIAIGNAAQALNTSAIAVGGNDGATSAGALASATRSVALGSGSVANVADSIVLGNPNSTAVGVTIGTSTPTTTPTTTSKLTIVISGDQNAITTSNGTVSAPAYSFIGTNTSVGMYSPGQNQLALVASNTARLLIDTTQSVTYFSQYKVHAYRSGAGQTVNGGANATIVFNSEASPGFDPNANFNTATGTYTAPVTGYYFVSFSVFSSIGGIGLATRTIAIQKNGATLTGYSVQQGANSTNGSPMAISAATIVQLNQNDTLRLNYANGGGSSDTIQANSFIDIHFMSF